MITGVVCFDMYALLITRRKAHSLCSEPPSRGHHRNAINLECRLCRLSTGSNTESRMTPINFAQNILPAWPSGPNLNADSGWLEKAGCCELVIFNWIVWMKHRHWLMSLFCTKNCWNSVKHNRFVYRNGPRQCVHGWLSEHRDPSQTYGVISELIRYSKYIWRVSTFCRIFDKDLRGFVCFPSLSIFIWKSFEYYKGLVVSVNKRKLEQPVNRKKRTVIDQQLSIRSTAKINVSVSGFYKEVNNNGTHWRPPPAQIVSF